MKKFLAILLVLVMSATVCGCKKARNYSDCGNGADDGRGYSHGMLV